MILALATGLSGGCAFEAQTDADPLEGEHLTEAPYRRVENWPESPSS